MPEYSSTTITPADGVKTPAMNGSTSGNYTLSDLRDFILASKGQANGLASLDANGKLPSSQLPDLADDVIVVASYATLPATGTAGKLYITADNNKMYRWDPDLATPDYVELSVDLSAYATIADLQDGTLEPLISTKAKQDQNGNVIDQTYETKADASELKGAIDANSNRISNLEQEHGGYVPVNYRGTNSVPTGKAKYGLVESIVGKTRAWNQLCNPISNTVKGVSVSVSNGKYTLSNTAYDDGGRTIALCTEYPMISGHKYLLIKIGTTSSAWSLNQSNNTYLADITTSGTIFTAGGSYNAKIGINVTNGTTYNEDCYIIIRDLSLILNDWADADITTANIPLMVKQIPDLLKYDSYGYSLVDTVVEGVVSVGFNRWDEQWEVGSINDSTGQNEARADTIRSTNYIPCSPSTEYYFKLTAYVFYYDINKNYIGEDYLVNQTRATPSNAYFIRFRTTGGYDTYLHDICINVSSSENGTYKPYMTDTLSLPSSVTLRSAGSVADTDELNVEVVVDGVKVNRRRQTTKVGSYTFTGNESWTTYSGTSKRTDITGLGAKSIGASDIPNIENDMGLVATSRTAIGSSGGITVSVTTIIISNDSVSLAVAGKKINFELDSYVETLSDPILDPFIQVEGGGTINTIQTQTPVIDNCMDVGYLAL